MMRIALFSIFGILLLFRVFFYYEGRQIYHENDPFKVTYSMSHEPKKNSYGQYFFVKDVMVTVPSFPTFHYGDTIKIDGKVSKTKSQKGEMLVVKNPKIEVSNNINLPVKISKFVRERVVSTVMSHLPSDEGGLLLGIILGVRDKIGKPYYEKLRLSGVLHVIAASGQNVSILASFLAILFSKIVKRKNSALFTGICVIFYAFLAGGDPAIVRASIMAIIGVGGLLIGTKNEAIWALFATGYIMAMYNPEMITDISFQLSFMSTLGIITLKVVLDRVFKIRFLDILKEDITTTLSAQIATFPIMMSLFGYYSVLSLPINVLVLWTIPIIMTFGGIGAVLSLIFPFLGVPFILLSYPFLAYFRLIIEIFSNITANLESAPWPSTLVFGYYLILFGIVIRFNSHGGKKT